MATIVSGEPTRAWASTSIHLGDAPPAVIDCGDSLIVEVPAQGLCSLSGTLEQVSRFADDIAAQVARIVHDRGVAEEAAERMAVAS